MYGLLDISTSGMVAQRTRMETISANIANADAILDAEGNVNAFRRRIAHFAAGNPEASTPDGRVMGVHIAEIEVDQAAVRRRFVGQGRVGADAEGYAWVPDIDPLKEQVNAMEAARSYEANVAAAETTKMMMAQALRLLA